MRHTIAIIWLLFIATTLIAQKKKAAKAPPWSDTAFISVKLNNAIQDRKIVAVDVGKKATIFVRLTPLLSEAKKMLSNDFVSDNYHTIINYLDSASLRTDTIFVEESHKLLYF